MIVPPTNVRVLIATKPVDFRKGAMRLAAIVEAEFKADPFSGRSGQHRLLLLPLQTHISTVASASSGDNRTEF